MASATVPPLTPDTASLGAVDLREYYRLRVESETRLRREQTVIDVRPTRVNLDGATQGRTTGTKSASSEAASAQTLATRQARTQQTQTQRTPSQRTKSTPQDAVLRTRADSTDSSQATQGAFRYAPGGKGQGISLENSPQTLGMLIDLTV